MSKVRKPTVVDAPQPERNAKTLIDDLMAVLDRYAGHVKRVEVIGALEYTKKLTFDYYGRVDADREHG